MVELCPPSKIISNITKLKLATNLFFFYDTKATTLAFGRS